ncbi:MAG: manganese efflux pump [Clostridia bacterium]|nr:manganese efflux pump [Clostridia bacterium]
MFFILESILLGLGLAMDASAVSMANGFSYPKMKIKKIILIALMFGLFQGVMPLIGYFIGHTIITYIEKWIPWIALIILCFLGGRMLYEALKSNDECEKVEKTDCKKLTFKTLIIQSIATSIDALSVGLTIADYSIIKAIICASFITIVTFACSFGSVFLGKKFGTRLGHRAEIIGGIILILIGIEIFVTGMFF